MSKIIECIFERDGKEVVEKYKVENDTEEEILISSFDEADGILLDVKYIGEVEQNV